MVFSLEEFIYIMWSLNVGFHGHRNKSITCPVIHKNVLLPRHSSSNTANRSLHTTWGCDRTDYSVCDPQTIQAVIHHLTILNLNSFWLFLHLFLTGQFGSQSEGFAFVSSTKNSRQSGQWQDWSFFFFSQKRQKFTLMSSMHCIPEYTRFTMTVLRDFLVLFESFCDNEWNTPLKGGDSQGRMRMDSIFSDDCFHTFDKFPCGTVVFCTI